MDLNRRILVVHADARVRRRLVLVLVESGYDVRAFADSEPALAAIRLEWFDLALIDFALPGGDGFGFAGRLREVQPTVPVIMLLAELELPLIIQGIRLGLTDVLPSDDDPRPVLRRVNALLRPGRETTFGAELAPADLVAVEEVLTRLDPPGEAGPAGEAAEMPADWQDQLVRATHERALLEARLERALHEKLALEAELRTLLSQNGDSLRLQAELAQLQSQREMAAAAQAAIDAKARQLAETRAEIAAERMAFEEARRGGVDGAGAPPAADPGLEVERAHLDAMREDLREEDQRLREEWARLRRDTTELAQERRRWHEELDQLREREENLRTYEQRLREMQTELEAQRIQLQSTAPKRIVEGDIVQHDAKLRAEWEKIHRANELLEAERNMFRDERMAMRDLERKIQAREARLRELEEQVAAQETIRRHLPPGPPPGHAVAAPPSTEERGGVFKAFTRAPFAKWGKG